MTEAEWPAIGNPKPMLRLLEKQKRLGDRKLRLFSCACGRRFWDVLTGLDRKVVELAEDFADGRVSEWELGIASDAACEAQPDDDELEGEDYRIAQAQIAATTCASIREYMVETSQELLKAAKRKSTERLAQCQVLQDIFGNPFRPVVADPAWLTPTVVAIATAIYADRAFDRMPILADALEEAGCTNADVLLHCRSDRPHVRGCWVVDLVLGKE